MVGKTISHYQILEKIGEGGMGVVYKAEDTRLDRIVALKFLASHLLESAEARERFTREAKAAAALDHPNIGTVYEIGETGGQTYLAMACIEGPTLKQKIDERPLQLKQALDFAIQVGQGLKAAHDRGVIHRDIKPANLMLSADGQIKIMDFGLAHLGGRTKITKTGVALGTPAYMAPEQLRGEPADRRADIWSFGVVLHEMITGQPPFEGETEEALSYAILHAEPEPLTALRSGVPVELDRVVAKLLAKDVDERYQHIDEALVDLRALSRRLPETPRTPTPGVQVAAARRSWIWPAVAALAALLAITVSVLWLRQPAPEIRSMRFLVSAPVDTQFTSPISATAASPDGLYLVFSAGSPASPAPLWLRPLDSLSARPLPGSEGGTLVFWSPDSKSIAYYADGKLKRSEIVGGAAQVLCDAAISRGAGGAWSRDGVILFASANGLFRVAASGGMPRQLTQLDAARKESGHGVPQFLPDGKRFLYHIQSADPNVQGTYASSLDKPEERRRLLAAENKACYVPPMRNRTGFLLWLRGQTLLAQPFDAATLRLEGDATPLAEDVAAPAGPRAGFWTSDAGLLVYRTGSADRARLVWMNRDGKRLGEVGKEDRYSSLRISPDGKRVAISRTDEGGNTDIWVSEFGREGRTRLTFDPKAELGPIWSPDGRQIAYSANRSGIQQIYRIAAGGGGREEQLTNGPNEVSALDWSRDGRYLLYVELDPKTGYDLWALPLEGERKPIAVLRSPFTEGRPQFSPDSKWITYESKESGRSEVYVCAFPASSGQWQISNQGGSTPKWRADGKELYFLGPNFDKVMAAGVRVVGASFQSDNPRELFAAAPIPSVPWAPYDVTADGQRFLVLQPSTGQQGPTPLTVITNWQASLKK